MAECLCDDPTPFEGLVHCERHQVARMTLRGSVRTVNGVSFEQAERLFEGFEREITARGDDGGYVLHGAPVAHRVVEVEIP